MQGKKKNDKKDKDDDEWEEVDEHEKDVFDKDGYFDVPENQGHITKNDEKLLEVLNQKKGQKKEIQQVNLADLIM